MKKLSGLIILFVLLISSAGCSSEMKGQAIVDNNSYRESENSLQKENNEKEIIDKNGEYEQEGSATNVMLLNKDKNSVTQVIKENKNMNGKQTDQGKRNQAILSEKDAVELVREHLGLNNNQTLHVEVDHEEENRYVVHVYEVVVHEDISHTATYGWYYVDKNSGKIEDMMQ